MKNELNIDKLRFPIGHFDQHTEVTPEHLALWKTTISEFPQKLKKLVSPLSSEELSWKYRPNGWAIKQVVHHLADSHMNSFIRFKLTLTEDAPTIRPYEEADWANVPDGLSVNIEPSLQILEGVHQRWSLLLENLSDSEWNKMYFHPQHQRLFSTKEALGIYDWHCRHHLAHIEQALFYKGKFNQ